MFELQMDHADANTGSIGGSVYDGVNLEQLADRLGTPCHVYSAKDIRRRINELQLALRGLDAQICFAVKANPLRAILQLMAAAGIGADIVSVGELRRALDAGIDPDRIVFSGVGKTTDEMRIALASRIARFNVESLNELETLQHVAAERGQIANVAVRVNPDVDAQTHAKISTGKSENKFGVSINEAHRWFVEHARYPNLRINGLHSGSGLITASAGATLGGSGSVVGDVNVADATLSPGSADATAGTFTMLNLSLTSSSTLAFDLAAPFTNDGDFL